jgi:tetratricopeptide (TPR) repeat protein
LGIPIGGGRRGRRRRSYADYKPPGRQQGPRDDPFRVFFYLVLIAAGVWVYLNRDMVRNEVMAQVNQLGQLGEAREREGGGRGTIRPAAKATPSPEMGADEFATQGDQAYQDGQLVEAIEFYRQAALLAPNTVEYHVQVARLLLFQSAMEYGDQRQATLDEALEAANGAILADPERPEGYAIMGKVLDWTGEPERAMSEIARALEIDPDYAVGRAYLAEAQADLKRWEQALETVEGALALAPDSLDVRRDYGYVLETWVDYAGAAAQYEAALAIHPNLPFLHMALGRAYREVGRYEEAIDQFFEIETLDPANVLLPFEVGRTYEAYVGDPNSALEYYERAVEIDPNYPYPWVRIGTIRYLQGNYEQAIPALERALALGIETAAVYYQLGLSYANEGDCQAAVPKLVEARSLAQGDEFIEDVVQSGLEMCPEEAKKVTPPPTATEEKAGE